MSHTSITRSSEVSDSDSETSYHTRRHPYNTRSSVKISTPRQIPKATRRRKPKSQCSPPNSDYNSQRRKGNNSSMDYCFEPCVPTHGSPKKNVCTNLFYGLFYIFLIGGIAFMGYSQHSMNKEVKQLKEEVHKIKGGHRKEDPHAKLSKELDKKCSDTLKLLLRDPVGRPDFALESSGGRVISVDSVAYSTPKTFLGFNICEGQHGPSSMIQATTSPGECWAFKGHFGKAVIQLIDYVLVDSVTLEHIPQTISPSGSIDTAPKDFKIWGLDNPHANKRLLGQFTYEGNGTTVQTFGINNDHDYYKYIEFEVVSNHGNRDFTCVYRIRVHGTAKKT